MARPLVTEFPTFYATYVNKTEGNSVADLIHHHSAFVLDFVQQLPKEKADFAYAEGKWTIKEVLQHLIDSERVFIYRALRFARKDTTSLAGFDENEYAANANVGNRTWSSLQEEFILLRKSSDLFLSTLTNEQLSFIGNANNNTISLNALCYIVFGHLLHHVQILQERYL
jgi:hypothetical protein